MARRAKDEIFIWLDDNSEVHVAHKCHKKTSPMKGLELIDSEQVLKLERK